MTPPTSPQALARALRERLDRTRSFIQDTMDTQHVPRGAISNLMSARDEVDATVSNLTALVTWALEMEEALKDFLNIAAHCEIKSGVCGCGEAMDGHSDPYSTGHSPTDMADQVVSKAIAAAEAALAKGRGA